VTSEPNAEPRTPQTPQGDQATQGPKPTAQNLLQVASKVSDLAARVDELEQIAAAAEPTPVGPTQPASGPTLLQDVLPEIKNLSDKVGGMEHLAQIVEILKQPKG
jgi:hypothetical protein